MINFKLELVNKYGDTDTMYQSAPTVDELFNSYSVKDNSGYKIKNVKNLLTGFDEKLTGKWGYKIAL